MTLEMHSCRMPADSKCNNNKCVCKGTLENVVTSKTWQGQLFYKQAAAKQMNCLFLLSGLQL